MKFLLLALLLVPPICFAAEPLFPTAEGTTWNYDFVGQRPSESLDLDEPDEEEKFAVTHRLGATQKVDNKELRRFEIYRGEELESVDLLAIEEKGIVCPARTDASGAVIKLNPPQIMLETPLKQGTAWTFDGAIGDAKVKQQYEIVDEEEVEVPAGKFQAWRIHCEQTLPSPAAIDRWFVPAIGFVKVETTVSGPSGNVLQRTSLKLKEPPKVTAPAAKKASSENEKFSANVSNEAKGEAKTEFKSDTPAIYARWRGHDLPEKAQVRAVFIAENVADVSADYEIDESTADAPAPNASGAFTLSKPEGGWTPGSYRVEFFVNDEPAQTAKFKVSK